MTDQVPQEHLVLVGRLVGTDEGWVDCSCGWHFEGTVAESRAAGERHMDTLNGESRSAELKE